MSFDRRTRIEQMRNADRARDRRTRVLVISLSAVVVAGLVTFGTYTLLDRSEASADQKAADAKDAKQSGTEEEQPADGPVKGEKTWDAKKLTRNHVTETVSYPMKPPVGGDHSPVWMNCDGEVYKKAIPDMNAVHALEHGSVWVTYTDKASAADVDKLAERVAKTPYSLMSPYKDQDGTLMLSAWGKQVTVDSADDPRVAQFFAKYVQGPQTPEPGAACTGGLAAP
ncbi:MULTISPECIES: DUF3105 domain-containing protein [unclassified Streptomyces]|uniref:DUF3105 domain-containing protein n=1 Tax=unclassified Streptomyces TaxID=2593676 RepID=UPI002254845C|nr:MULTISPECIES: DUF3105 domain-containing protein [unclassified Streptomyces]MCX5139846.1 DUF3105 domain-containing protein [Streptomyces sp. NBC_00338]WRZ64497.1 DUF3105 domain-containing protein [Streptomyces sp. NBC_01257]WSU58460.1 DUF3105 domain-containing protein [Streptomyces sp. NBC_01104]